MFRPESRREMQRDERRRRIVEAAVSLVRESGSDAVSMIQIAERAGVSPATLYNLFETKGGIFRHVYDLEHDDYERRVERARAKHPLDRIFVAIDVAISRSQRDPQLHRAMSLASSNGGDRLSAFLRERRMSFWRELVRTAVAEGQLRADADPELLGAAVAYLVAGPQLAGRAAGVSAKRLVAEVAYGVATLMSAVATPEALPGLQARVAWAQTVLAARPGAGRVRSVSGKAAPAAGD